MHILERDILLHAGRENVWEFLATPINLNELTPTGLEFKIDSGLPDTMYVACTAVKSA